MNFVGGVLLEQLQREVIAQVIIRMSAIVESITTESLE